VTTAGGRSKARLKGGGASTPKRSFGWYRVECLTDACQAETAERRTAALLCFQGYREQINAASFEAAMLSPTEG